MKVVTLEEFLQYPTGTIFCKFEPNRVEELCILQTSLIESNDFTYSCVSNPIREFDNWNKLYADYDCVHRDGCFELDQLFIVYTQQDVLNLINTLQYCIDRTNIND